MAIRDEYLKSQSKSVGASKPSNNYAAAMNAVRSTVSTQPATQPMSRTNETLGTIGQLANAQPFQYQAPAAFSYDQNNDPAYQAALSSARANISQGQADTNAVLRSGGQGKSSYSESVANQISSKEMGRVSTDVLPQLISQAYQRYSDQSSRDLQVQQANYGAQQDQVSNLARLYGMQDQQDFQNPMAEAQLTGQYLSGEARQYIDAINSLKQQAEIPGIPNEQVQGYRQQADAYRAALQGLGVDASMFGADVNRETAMGNMGRAGLVTLDKQQQNYAQQADQRNFDRGVDESDRGFDRGVLEADRGFDFQKAQTEWENNFKTGQFDWQKAQQTWENSFQEKNFQQQMQEAAASRGLQWASLGQRQKEHIADQAFREKQFGLEQAKFDASASGQKNIPYTQNPDFADDIAFINADPASAINEIRGSAQDLIATYGYDGYQALLKAAEQAMPKDTGFSFLQQ